jgi:solute:Na+ symporter, SSS family
LTYFGLHILDWVVIALYFASLVAIALWTKRKIRNSGSFFQADRSFGKAMTAVINFGNMTSADQAAGVTREIYRQGLPGVWFQNLVLFLTPFFWFSSVLQRRARYVGPGDLYEHRFESKFLSGLFAVYLLLAAIYGSSLGYLITGKTIQAIMVKPANEYSLEEKGKVQLFEEMKALDAKKTTTEFSVQDNTRLTYLRELEKKGDISSTISYVDLTWFFIFYGLITAFYVIAGGLFAAALNDVIQAVLIIFLSLALIPLGLSALGGFAGLHAKVPEEMFQLFGSSAASEYPLYFVLIMALTNLIGLAPKQFTLGGAAKDDRAARIGMTGGAFTKRFMMIGWALTGLIALGLYGGTLSDATHIWGTMTRDLLGVGLVGLMIAAILSANMSAGNNLEWAAAFTKNILLPLRPKTTDKTQVFAGRLVIVVVIIGGIGFAYVVNDIFVVFKYVLSIGTVVGPAIWLVYFWRRLTTKAVIVQMILSLMMTVAMPNIIPAFDSMRNDPSLTIQTHERKEINERTGKEITIASAPIFFEKVERINPSDPNSPKVGAGTFKPQLWIVDKLGFDLRSFSKAGLATASFLVDIIFPFLVLFIVSLLTKPNSQKALREFYARINTPALADPVIDKREVEKKVSNPELVEANKLFPNTNWEFWKPTREDIVGFALCWVGVAIVIALYYLLVNL